MLTRFVRFLALLSVVVLLSPACSDDDDGPVGGGPGMTGQPPVISMVTWTQAPGCAPGVRSNVTIVTVATDPDTAAANLTYSGAVSSCGPIASDSVVVSCPQRSPYAGTVTVTDTEGNSATANFSVVPCQNGQWP